MSAITLRALHKSYGSNKVLSEVTAEIGQGELLTILGPSGSGKSTILNIIAGLTDPSSGDILIGDRVVTALPPAKRNIGIVFQSYALFPHMSARKNVEFPLLVRKLSEAERNVAVGRVLDMVQLGPHADKRPGQLSGGQQQRVALARALVFNPSILLLDEPLGALDRQLRDQLQIELKDLQRKTGVTTILVTHDQEEALTLSDRILVLRDGAIQQCAQPQDIYAGPANRFVAEFFGSPNIFEGQCRPGNGDWIVDIGSGHSFGSRAPASGQPKCVTVVIRPEQLALSRSGTGPGCYATISNTVYLGQAMRYRLVLDDGRAITAQIPWPGPQFAQGERVFASCPPSAVSFLPD